MPTTVNELAALQQWWTDTGNSGLTTVEGLMNDFAHEAAGSQDLGLIAALSQEIGDQWDQLYQSVPTDSEIGQAAQDAFAACSSATHNIHDAVVRVNVAALNAATGELQVCTVKLKVATAKIKGLDS